MTKFNFIGSDFRQMSGLSYLDPLSSFLAQYTINLFFFFKPCHIAFGILVPQPGIKPKPSAVKVQNPNHWTTREFPQTIF